MFRGQAYGAVGETFGEAVFSTGMTGYQETLTDPSYHRQVVVHDRAAHRQHRRQRRGPRVGPHLGRRLRRPRPRPRPSNWRSQRSLDDELERQGIVGISGIDTRALTRHLRERGAMRVGVSVDARPTAGALLDACRGGAGDGRRRPGRRGHHRRSRTSCPAGRAGGSPSRRSTSASRR